MTILTGFQRQYTGKGTLRGLKLKEMHEEGLEGPWITLFFYVPFLMPTHILCIPGSFSQWT